MTKETLQKIIDAFMAEMFAELPLMKYEDKEILSECFKEIDKYWNEHKEKLIADTTKYLNDVDGIEVK